VSPAASPDTDEASRTHAVLQASFAVFMRYGYRKTSMDEVARAAGLSRQGLYLHFSNKEALFRATVEHALQSCLDAATDALQAEKPLEARIAGAFDAWVGRYVGMMGSDAADLAEAIGGHLAPVVARFEEQFADAVTKAIRTSGLANVYKPAGLSARQLADTLYATARGLKHQSESRAAFMKSMTVAVRAMCLPLEGGR
jgi:AcrR family transcriptional regulator